MSTVNVINGTNSTLLDFDFSTENQAAGSFTLKTSVQDSDSTIGSGLFQNAVTNITYPAFGISEAGPVDISTLFIGSVVIFSAQDKSNSFGFLDVYLDYNNPDRLSNDPDDYFISKAGNYAGYGGFIQDFDPVQGQFSIITGLNVTKLITGTNQSDIILGTADQDKLKGLNGDDLLFGNADNDILDGGGGKDRLVGGVGADKFVLKAGEGTDTVLDFQDGIDSFVLANGLEFGKLTITQGIGQTLIKLADTNEVLASLVGVQTSNIGAGDFTTTLV